MRPRQLRRLLLIVVGVVTIYGAYVFWVVYGESLADWLHASLTARGLPNAQVRFDKLLHDIQSITSDTRLDKNQPEPLEVPSSIFVDCMRGSVQFVYGARRPYSDVVADYKSALGKMGWQYKQISADRAFYWTDVASLFMRHLTPSQTAEIVGFEPELYPTLYWYEFAYAEPSIDHCWE